MRDIKRVSIWVGVMLSNVVIYAAEGYDNFGGGGSVGSIDEGVGVGILTSVLRILTGRVVFIIGVLSLVGVGLKMFMGTPSQETKKRLLVIAGAIILIIGGPQLIRLTGLTEAGAVLW